MKSESMAAFIVAAVLAVVLSTALGWKVHREAHRLDAQSGSVSGMETPVR